MDNALANSYFNGWADTYTPFYIHVYGIIPIYDSSPLDGSPNFTSALSWIPSNGFIGIGDIKSD